MAFTLKDELAEILKRAGRSTPRVLNKHKDRIPPDAVFCGRGSPYGNPYVIGKHGNRDQCCDKFEEKVLPKLDVKELRGKDLICFCKPKRCHCDPILLKANPHSWRQNGNVVSCDFCGIVQGPNQGEGPCVGIDRT